ncbi:MAG: helix-turn-helix transcriptional regulator [Proteobacteria bacterium]|jgi:transcriptional regulator with XRE-family HTH domain|nr:helix-turn-helix transcriptional regulator [Pseudomonadota bacterium]
MYKERRKALGWSRADLANKAHVNKATLQLIEMGQSLDDESIARIEEVLSRTEAGEKDVMLPRVAVGKKS